MDKFILKISTLFLLCFLPVYIYAYDFEVDGIYYTVTSFNEKTVEVSKGDIDYSGVVIIPETITYNDTEFRVTAIGKKSFNRCDGLIQVILNNNILLIGENAFSDCTGLNSVKIGDNVTTIGARAFLNCKSLSLLIIPPNVNYIEEYAFKGCLGLKELYCLDSPNILNCRFGSQYVGPFDDCPLEIAYLGRDKGSSSFQTSYGASILNYTMKNLHEIWFGKYFRHPESDIIACALGEFTNLEKIFCRGITPLNATNKFTNFQYLNVKLFVPQGCYDSYRSSNVFGNFISINEFDAENIPVNKIYINKSSLEITEKDTYQFTYDIIPPYSTNKNVLWRSLNDDVCSISNEGMLTANSEGISTIIVSSQSNPNVYTNCLINVHRKSILVTEITLAQNNISIGIGETTQIGIKIVPINATNPTIEWSSTDKNIARITSDGTIIGVNEGVCYITAMATDGSNISDICQVIVNKQSGIDNLLIEPNNKIQIYSIDGKPIYQDINKLAHGIYIIRYGNYTKKVVITN